MVLGGWIYSNRFICFFCSFMWILELFCVILQIAKKPEIAWWRDRKRGQSTDFPPSSLHFTFFCSSSLSLFLCVSSPSFVLFQDFLGRFSALLSVGLTAACNHNHHFKAILRTFYPNLLPPGVSWRNREEVEGSMWGRRTTKTVECLGFNLSPVLSAICPPHSFWLHWEFLCLEQFLSVENWC